MCPFVTFLEFLAAIFSFSETLVQFAVGVATDMKLCWFQL